MTITPETIVKDIATKYPLSTRVFARHKIDFCCGGDRPLASFCEDKGLDTERVIEEIQKEVETSGSPAESWADAAPADLIRHILATYHQPLYEEMPRLKAMAKKVLDVHGDKDPERFRGIYDTLSALVADLEQHMAKEEQILFPMIQAGQGAMAGGPISVMQYEHENAGEMLRTLRSLTNDYAVPAEACATWGALWKGLEALETALHEHIHLENNILFPRVQSA